MSVGESWRLMAISTTSSFLDLQSRTPIDVAENICQQVLFRVFGQKQGLFGKHLPLEEGRFDLTDEFPDFVSLSDGEYEVKEFFLRRGAAFEQFEVMCPGKAR